MLHTDFKAWLKAALIRALRTLAQAAIAAIGTTAVTFSEVNWLVVLSTSGFAALLSLLTSVVTGLPEVDTGSTVPSPQVEPKPSTEPDASEERQEPQEGPSAPEEDNLPTLNPLGLSKAQIQARLVSFYNAHRNYISPDGKESFCAADVWAAGLSSFNPQNQPWCVTLFVDAVYYATQMNKSLTLALLGCSERGYAYLDVSRCNGSLTKLTIHQPQSAYEVGDLISLPGEDGKKEGHCGYIIEPSSSVKGCMKVFEGNCIPDSRCKTLYFGPSHPDIDGMYRLHWEVLDV